MLYFIVISLLFFSMKFIFLHKKMYSIYVFFNKVLTYNIYILLIVYWIFNIFWILVNMYLKVMEFLGKIIISYNNLIYIFFFSVVRLVITSFLIIYLRFINRIIRELFIVMEKDLDIYFFIKWIVSFIVYISLWYFIFEIDVLRFFVIITFIFFYFVIQFFIEDVIKEGIVGFFKHDLYSLVFSKWKISTLFYLILYLDDSIWNDFLSNRFYRVPQTITYKIASEAECMSIFLLYLYDKYHKGTYIGYVYESWKYINYKFNESSKPLSEEIFQKMLFESLGGVDISNFQVNTLGFSNYNFFIRIYFYKKYGNYSIIDYRVQLLGCLDIKDYMVFQDSALQNTDQYKEFFEKNFPQHIDIIDKNKDNESLYFLEQYGLKKVKDLDNFYDNLEKMEWPYYQFDEFKFVVPMDWYYLDNLLIGYFRIVEDNSYKVDYLELKRNLNWKEVCSLLLFFIFI